MLRLRRAWLRLPPTLSRCIERERKREKENAADDCTKELLSAFSPHRS
jgi:hypothetical protein